jgi:hypothetical protein
MAGLASLLSDPNYTGANAATKQAIFDKFAPQDPNFVNANPETQLAIRSKFGLTPVDGGISASRAVSQIPTEAGANLTPTTAPPVSMRDRIMGVIETPLALGATLAGGVIAPIVGVAGTLASGKYGTQEGIRAGEEAMKAVQYQPRTQTAREALGAVGEFLQPVTNALPPTLGSVGTSLNALAIPAVQQAGAMVRPAISQAVAPVRNALTRQQPDMVGMGAASTAEDLMRQQRLEQFGIRATAGERERNLQKQQFESEVQRGVTTGISEDAKTALSEKMRAFEAGKQKDIVQNFERMTAEVGSTADRGEIKKTGRIVDKALNNEYTKKFDAYKEKYKLADESGETLQQVPYQNLLDYIGTKSTTRREKLDPILNDVAELLAMNDPQKTGTISIRNLEDIYQVVGTAKDSPSAKPMKDLITKIGDGAGGKLYQEARQARTQLAKEFEDVIRVDKLLNTKAGYADRKIALADVYDHIVVDGSLEEMRTVTSLLKKTPEGRVAYQELQGQTLQRMKDLLLKKGDETDSVRLDRFNNFVTELDREEKLAYMFGKAGRDEIMDLRKAIKDVMVKEPGAVNYSNTSGAVLRGLEALQKLRIPGAKSAAEMARTSQVKRQVEESLKQPNQLAPPQNRIQLNNMAPGRP